MKKTPDVSAVGSVAGGGTVRSSVRSSLFVLSLVLVFGATAPFAFAAANAIPVDYYTATANNGADFIRSSGVFSTSTDTGGTVSQITNSDGSVTVNASSTSAYADSGFYTQPMKLGDVKSVTVTGSGSFGVNIYLDTSTSTDTSTNKFFTWDENNKLSSVGGDAYGSNSGTLPINGASSFYMMAGDGTKTQRGSTYTLDALKLAYPADTLIAFWVGVNVSGGSQSATISNFEVAYLPVLNETTGNRYSTIQAAIDAAGSGNTINVAAGEYNENVTIPTGVTLTGAGTSTTRITGQVTVNAASTTISGFSITDPSGNFGVLINGVGGVTVSNNAFMNIGTSLGAVSGLNNAYGVYFQGHTTGSVSDITISNNTINGVGDTTILKNSNSAIGIGDSNATGVLSGLVISNNTISNVSDSPLAYGSGGRGAYGILLNYGAKAGGSVAAPQITGNSVSNLSGYWSTGIGLEGNTPSAVVTGNTLNNITASTANGATAIHFDMNPSSASVSLNDNSFDTTSISFGVTSSIATTVDASSNFWNTGTTNPSSKTSTTGGAIYVSPWFSDSAMTTRNYPTTGGLGDNQTTTISSKTTETTTNGGKNITVEIPSGTIITGDSTWSGSIQQPTVVSTPVAPTPDNGFTATPVLSIEVGSPTVKLTFSQPVKLTFEGQADNLIGWSLNGSFTPITATCNSLTTPTLAAGADCRIPDGSNLVVWTRHFTTFTTYMQTPVVVTPPSSHGGGGGGVACPAGTAYNPSTSSCTPVRATPATPAVPGVSPAVPATPSINSNGNANGQVLGASTFNFTRDLGVGLSGADVTALQQILIDAGILKINAPTGNFGQLTKAAVQAFQKSHGVSETGFVGPLTRGKLNKGVTPTATNLTSVQADSILSLLESFGADASVVAKVRASLGR